MEPAAASAPRHIFQRAGVLGGGAWGTALAQSLRRAGRDVTLWAYETATVAEIGGQHTNGVYLPGVPLDPGIGATTIWRTRGPICCFWWRHRSSSAPARLAPHLAPGTPVAICAKGFGSRQAHS
jgi:glycerol-3-phosphate dehydrogenase (NAD(P)+)